MPIDEPRPGAEACKDSKGSGILEDVNDERQEPGSGLEGQMSFEFVDGASPSILSAEGEDSFIGCGSR